MRGEVVRVRVRGGGEVSGEVVRGEGEVVSGEGEGEVVRGEVVPGGGDGGVRRWGGEMMEW